MIALILCISMSLIASLIFTPILIKFLTNNQLGQFIRQDGPQSHLTKRGTPTMGGVVIVAASVLGYTAGALWMYFTLDRIPKVSSMLVLGLMVAMGLVGFIDDFAKITKQQSLGLTPILKITLQGIIGIVFAILCMNFANGEGFFPATRTLSFLGDFFSLDFAGPIVGIILFVIWINLIITAWTNAINLTDGLDGLAVGTSFIAFLSYIAICFWQFTHGCDVGDAAINICYNVRDPWDLTLVAGSIVGACLGFLWYNASPAKIFMGDTGSLALGGAFAAISILSHTELLAIIIGGIFVLECFSDVIQVGYFKLTRKRFFKMAPIHHHFELKGWQEITVVIRFWVISILLGGAGIGLFYAGWLQGLVFN